MLAGAENKFLMRVGVHRNATCACERNVVKLRGAFCESTLCTEHVVSYNGLYGLPRRRNGMSTEVDSVRRRMFSSVAATIFLITPTELHFAAEGNARPELRAG
jgi:hypothetical protein